MEEQKQKFDIKAKLTSLWAGNVPLFETFWIYYFAVMVVLAILGSSLPGIGALLFFVQVGWAGFMIKPIWLAAGKYAGPGHWAMLAKIVTIFIALGVIGNIAVLLS